MGNEIINEENASNIEQQNAEHMNHAIHHEMHHTQNDGHGGHGSHDMATYFYFGYENVQMLFKRWIITDAKSLLIACFVLLGLFNTDFSSYRNKLLKHMLKN